MYGLLITHNKTTPQDAKQYHYNRQQTTGCESE